MFLTILLVLAGIAAVVYVLWMIVATKDMVQAVNTKVETQLASVPQTDPDGTPIVAYSVVLNTKKSIATRRRHKVENTTDYQLVKCKGSSDISPSPGRYDDSQIQWLAFKQTKQSLELWEKVAAGKIRYMVVNGGITIRVWTPSTEVDDRSHVYLLGCVPSAFVPEKPRCSVLRVVYPLPSTLAWRAFFESMRDAELLHVWCY